MFIALGDTLVWEINKFFLLIKLKGGKRDCGGIENPIVGSFVLMAVLWSFGGARSLNLVGCGSRQC